MRDIRRKTRRRNPTLVGAPHRTAGGRHVRDHEENALESTGPPTRVCSQLSRGRRGVALDWNHDIALELDENERLKCRTERSIGRTNALSARGVIMAAVGAGSLS